MEQLYVLYIQYNLNKEYNNENFEKIIKYFDKIITNKLNNVLLNDRDDIHQELLMILDNIFKKKPIKINKRYYLTPYLYKKSNNIELINWQKYYSHKLDYRNKIGSIIVKKYVTKSFDNKILDYYKKKREVLLLNRQDKDGIEYIDYIKDTINFNINIEILLKRHINLFKGKTLTIIECKLKHYRKGDCPKFRYITTSG